MAFFKKNRMYFVVLIVILVICGVVYWKQPKWIDAVASILAIPSVVLSIIVLEAVDIKPENLEAYYRLRRMTDNEKRENKKRAKTAFEEMFTQIEKLITKNFSNFYKNKKAQRTVAKSAADECVQSIDKVILFFDETKDYICRDFLVGANNIGEIYKIYQSSVVLFDAKDEKKLSESLYMLNHEIFHKVNLSKEDFELLEELFGEDALMQKYCKTCFYAFNMIKEENDEI